MAAPGRCPQCGDRLPADTPHGICPKCMLGLGFDDPQPISLRGDQPTQEPGGRFAAPSVSELAEHFPQLEILDLIGQGGMGSVYRVRQKALDRVVALKVLPLEVGRDPAFAERFAREARAMARLTHPHIVVIFDFGQADGFFYFIMEYVAGVNLRQALAAGRLSPQQALAIVPQICEALQFAHDEGIVHRDIKPENVLLDKRGNVKIADFGLAKLLGRTDNKLTLTGTGQVMGTPHYMAPEQFERPLEVDHRADIYSLGVVFYELLTGELPLGRFAPPSQKTDVPADLDQVVLRTLEKEPALRYQQASEVKTAVQTASSGGFAPSHATAPPVAQTAGQTRRLRVPFTIGDVYAGFAKATGSLRLTGDQVLLEFEVKDDVFGYVKSGIKSVSIPLTEIVSFQLLSNWLGWGHNIELMTDQLQTLQDVPRSEQGRVRLQIARRDLPAARQVTEAVQRATNQLPPEEIRSPVHSRPPVSQPHTNLSKTREAIRGPAIGLQVVGVLNCFSPFLMVLALMFGWTHTRVVEPVEIGPVDIVAPSPHWQNQSIEVRTTTPLGSAQEATVVHVPTMSVRPQPTVSSPILFFPLLFVVPLQLGLAILMLIGAAKMKQLRSYGLAITGCMIALLPIHPWFLLGLPFGVWGLVVLSRRDTRGAFDARRTPDLAAVYHRSPSPEKPMPDGKPGWDEPGSTEVPLTAPAVVLLVCGVFNLMFLLPASFILLARGAPTFLLLLVACFPVLTSLMQIVVGRQLAHGPSRSAAISAIVVAVLPLTPLWLLTLPVGIWIAILLRNGAAMSVHAIASSAEWNEPTPRGQRLSRAWWPVLLAVAMLLGGLAAAGAFLTSRIGRLSHTPHPSSVPHVQWYSSDGMRVIETPVPPDVTEMETMPVPPVPLTPELPPAEAGEATQPAVPEQPETVR